MKRIGMGLVGPGFVGAHHIDAVRRLGFVDVVAVAASSEASARRKADALGVPKAYGSAEALVADPDIHVVHNTTPNYLHAKIFASCAWKHAGRTSRWPRPRRTRGSLDAANGRPSSRGDVQLLRNPLVQQARDDRRRRPRRGALHPRRTCRTGCPADRFLVAPRAGEGGDSSAVGDIGSHWCDLVQHVSGRRIVEVLADLTTVIDTRLKPAASTEAFAQSGDVPREAVRISSEDLATILLRFDDGAKGSVSVGQVCRSTRTGCGSSSTGAGRRCVGSRSGRTGCGSPRDAANAVLARDPSLLLPGAQPYTHLPGGHQEGWADAFCNVMRDVYGFIAAGKRPGDPRPPAFATFEDGYQSACVVDAILESHRNGSVWTAVSQTVTA
jgi:predicted dehydrogenase